MNASVQMRLTRITIEPVTAASPETAALSASASHYAAQWVLIGRSLYCNRASSTGTVFQLSMYATGGGSIYLEKVRDSQ
jgi:hypothetical protein